MGALVRTAARVAVCGVRQCMAGRGLRRWRLHVRRRVPVMRLDQVRRKAGSQSRGRPRPCRLGGRCGLRMPPTRLFEAERRSMPRVPSARAGGAQRGTRPGSTRSGGAGGNVRRRCRAPQAWRRAATVLRGGRRRGASRSKLAQGARHKQAAARGPAARRLRVLFLVSRIRRRQCTSKAATT